MESDLSEIATKSLSIYTGGKILSDISELSSDTFSTANEQDVPEILATQRSIVSKSLKSNKFGGNPQENSSLTMNLSSYNEYKMPTSVKNSNKLSEGDKYNEIKCNSECYSQRSKCTVSLEQTTNVDGEAVMTEEDKVHASCNDISLSTKKLVPSSTLKARLKASSPGCRGLSNNDQKIVNTHNGDISVSRASTSKKLYFKDSSLEPIRANLSDIGMRAVTKGVDMQSDKKSSNSSNIDFVTPHGRIDTFSNSANDAVNMCELSTQKYEESNAASEITDSPTGSITLSDLSSQVYLRMYGSEVGFSNHIIQNDNSNGKSLIKEKSNSEFQDSQKEIEYLTRRINDIEKLSTVNELCHKVRKLRNGVHRRDYVLIQKEKQVAKLEEIIGKRIPHLQELESKHIDLQNERARLQRICDLKAHRTKDANQELVGVKHHTYTATEIEEQISAYKEERLRLEEKRAELKAKYENEHVRRNKWQEKHDNLQEKLNSYNMTAEEIKQVKLNIEEFEQYHVELEKEYNRLLEENTSLKESISDDSKRDTVRVIIDEVKSKKESFEEYLKKIEDELDRAFVQENSLKKQLRKLRKNNPQVTTPLAFMELRPAILTGDSRN